MIAITGGNNQSTDVSNAFGTDLEVTVSSAFSEPVRGGSVSFTAPGSGASASLGSSLATIGSMGIAKSSATANGTPGVYSVSAATTGATSQNFSLTNSMVFSPTALPASSVGVAYSQAISTTGGTGTVSFTTSDPLPDGITLAADGTLSGTPAEDGSFPITVTATDSASTPNVATFDYTLMVNAGIVSIDTTTLPSAAVGVFFTANISASGGTAPYAFTSTGTLPTGLTLNPTTGELSGTPTAAGRFDFSVTATDSSGGTGPFTASQDYTLTLDRVAQTISFSTPAAVPFSAVATATLSAFASRAREPESLG